MCGIFGISTIDAGKQDFPFLKKGISKLLRLSEARGREASGIAMLVNQRLEWIKDRRSGRYLLKSPPR